LVTRTGHFLENPPFSSHQQSIQQQKIKNKTNKQTNRSQLLTHKLKCRKPETEQEKIKILHSPPTGVPKENFNPSTHHTAKIIKVSNHNNLHSIFLFDWSSFNT
jgi:hypothetical protein